MFGTTAISLLLVVSGASFTLSEDYLSPRQEHVERGIKPAAAAGEVEIVTLTIPQAEKARSLVTWQLAWQGKSGPQDTWYRPASRADFLPGMPPVADALVPLMPIELAAHEDLEIVLVLEVPTDLAAGDYRAKLRLEFADGGVMEEDFPFVVYDFTLPESRSLATLFDVDLHALSRTYGWAYNDLDAWLPVYDTLQRMNIAYRVWFDTTSENALADEADLQAHRNYVCATGTQNLVDVGGQPGALLSQYPEPTAFEPQDGLQLQLYKTQARLPAVAGTLKRVAQPAAFGPREAWNELRQGYARFARADEHVQRILAAPAHPYFERYAEIWALPADTDPAVLARLATGLSLYQYDQQGIGVCLGSPGALDGSNTYQTLASEVVDGSEVTGWQAAASPGGAAPWIEITFQSHRRLADLTVIYDSGSRWHDLQVETAYVAGEYTVATVNWERDEVTTALGRRVAQGHFRFPRECLGVRFRLDEEPEGTEFPAIAEILFNNPDLERIETAIPAQTPWMDAADTRFLAWQPGQGQRARALPWRCWTLGFHGVFGPLLNAHGAGEVSLLALGPGQIYPTRRLFAFRDGLEDYEYLQLFWERIARNELSQPAGFYPGAGPEAFDDSQGGAAVREKMRKRMGEILSGKSTVTRNFGP